MFDNRVRLNLFEGPLDLLLYLVQKNEMPINDINLHEITGQYLQMIQVMKDYSIDLAGDFLLMAATLIKMKSDSLLPENQESEDAEETELAIATKEELERRLQELLKFKKAGEKLGTIPRLGEDVFKRKADPPEVIRERVLRTPAMSELAEVFADHLFRKSRKLVPIKTDKVTIKDKILQIRNLFKNNEYIEFTSLVQPGLDPEEANRETIVSFITILELARLQLISIFQNDHESEILVKNTKDLSGEDLNDLVGAIAQFGMSDEEIEKQKEKDKKVLRDQRQRLPEPKAKVVVKDGDRDIVH